MRLDLSRIFFVLGGQRHIFAPLSLHFGKDFGGVGVGFYLWHNIGYNALLVDNKGCADYAKGGLAVHLFLLPNIVCLDSRKLGIREKDKWEAVLLGKILMRCNTITADADDHNTTSLELMVKPCKGAGLSCAAGGIIFWVKVNDYSLADKVGQSYLSALTVKECDLGCFSSYL